jgi:hypothetical protein
MDGSTMDRNDSFDIEEFERKADSIVTSTAWSSRVVPKFKGRRAYGRRGSDAVFNSRTKRNESLPENRERHDVNVDQDQEEESGLDDNEDWTLMTSPYNKTFNEYTEVPTPPPRQLKKWKTISGESPSTLKPNEPPKLMRSQSVSALLPKRRAFGSSRSTSTASSFASFAGEEGGINFENLNPNNFFPASNNLHGQSILEENTSPKRSAVVEGNKKGRKKSKATNQSFVHNNDFRALNKFDRDGHNTRGNRYGSRKIPAPGSFSDLARSYSEGDPAWKTSSTGSYRGNDEMNRRRSYSSDIFSPSSSFHDETMDVTDLALSPTTSTASSRKRGVYKSQFLIDESPVLRSRSRILSPLPTRTTELPFLTNSIDSIQRTESKLMNISFYSTNNEKKISRSDLDVTMSDDDLYVSGDSDISVDSEDEVMTTESSKAFRGVNPPLSAKSTRICDPEKISVEDVVKIMPCYDDIQFLSISLKQNFEGQGGCLSWNIAPPVNWVAKRRDAFFQATKKFGFTFRAAGGTVSFIQISKSRGSSLFSLLNSTLEIYDELKERERLPNTQEKNTPQEIPSSAANKSTKAQISEPKE